MEEFIFIFRIIAYVLSLAISVMCFRLLSEFIKSKHNKERDFDFKAMLLDLYEGNKLPFTLRIIVLFAVLFTSYLYFNRSSINGDFEKVSLYMFLFPVTIGYYLTQRVYVRARGASSLEKSDFDLFDFMLVHAFLLLLNIIGFYSFFSGNGVEFEVSEISVFGFNIGMTLALVKDLYEHSKE